MALTLGRLAFPASPIAASRAIAALTVSKACFRNVSHLAARVGRRPAAEKRTGVSRLPLRARMASGSYGPPALKTIVRNAAPGKHTSTIVWLHGLGDTGEGWADVVEMVGLSHIKWVLPSATIMPVSVNGGFPCPSWFDILGLAMGSPEDSRGIDLAARHIASILKEEQKDGIKLAVGGFSQGGALSLYLTMRKALGKFLDGELKGLSATESGRKVAAEHPVLMCHGTSDMVVQYAFGKASADEMTSAGFSNVTFNTYPGMAHEASPKELADLRTWLEKNL